MAAKQNAHRAAVVTLELFSGTWYVDQFIRARTRESEARAEVERVKSELSIHMLQHAAAEQSPAKPKARSAVAS